MLVAGQVASADTVLDPDDAQLVFEAPRVDEIRSEVRTLWST